MQRLSPEPAIVLVVTAAAAGVLAEKIIPDEFVEPRQRLTCENSNFQFVVEQRCAKGAEKHHANVRSERCYHREQRFALP